jgi:hypothetical protein
MAAQKIRFRAFSNPTVPQFIMRHEEAIREAVRKLPDEELFGPGGPRVDATTSEQQAYDAQLNTRIAKRLAYRAPLVEVDKRTKSVVATTPVTGYDGSRYGGAPKQLIEYRMPVKGQMELLEVMPGSMTGANRIPEIHVIRGGVDGEIAVYIPDYGDNPQQVVDDANAMLEALRDNSKRLFGDLDSYLNGGVIGTVGAAVAQERRRREAERQRQDDLLSRLP